MNKWDYDLLLSETVDDLTYWLNEIIVLPTHRKDWARGKAMKCILAIKELSAERKELE